MGKSTEFEGTQEAEGSRQSIEETSQGEQTQPSAQEQQLVASLLKNPAASELVADMVAKEFQKNKDKRLQQVDENKSEIARVRELVEGKGMSFEDAEAQIHQENTTAEIQDQLQKVLSGQAGQVGDTNKPWTEREATILGIVSPKDPEVIRFRNQFDDEEEYLKELPKKVWQMVKRPEASEASASGGQGTAVDEDLVAEYSEEMSNIRRGDVRAIDALKRKYRKKGLQVW